MKIPFDIEKAKAGYQVVTRGGHEVTILKHDLKNEFPIVGIYGFHGSECPNQWRADGKNYVTCSENQLDLFLIEPKAVYEVNDIYVNRMIKNPTCETIGTICRATTKEYADLILKALQFYEDNKPQSE